MICEGYAISRPTYEFQKYVLHISRMRVPGAYGWFFINVEFFFRLINVAFRSDEQLTAFSR